MFSPGSILSTACTDNKKRSINPRSLFYLIPTDSGLLHEGNKQQQIIEACHCDIISLEDILGARDKTHDKVSSRFILVL